MKNEIKSLTGLRGIVALWVTFFHFEIGFLPQIIENGYIAVDIFFVLSAYLLTVSYSEKFKEITFDKISIFYKKRINRIYPVYFLSMLFIAFFVSKVSLVALVINTGLLQCFFNQNYSMSIVYWSLSTEWICYLIFPFMLYLIIRCKINPLLLIVVSLLMRYFLQDLPDLYFTGRTVQLEIVKSGKYLDVIYGVNSLVRTISSYFLGIAFAFMANGKIWKNNILIYGVIVISFSLFFIEKGLFFIPLVSAIIIKYLYNGKSSLFTFFLETKVIYVLGNISYSLYIIHYIIKKMRIVWVDSSTLNSFLLIGLSIVLSYFSYVLIEKRLKIFKV